MMEKTPVVSLKDADILSGESTILYGVNMNVYAGDFLYIVGKVGTGKTSIVRTLIAEAPLGGGTGFVCGFPLHRLRERDIPYLRRKVGVVFQDFQLLMDRSVQDNLEFVLRATGWKDRSKIGKRIRTVLEDVGMAAKSHKMPHQLSGGEQQRVAIARSILNSPEVIVADEPTGNLDMETADGILRLLRRINAEENAAVILITHNRTLFERYRGRIMVCKDERCTEQPEEDTIDLDLTI